MARQKKITLWRALMQDDWQGYSIRERTKKECKRRRREEADMGPFGLCEKVIIPYDNTFDLICRLCGSETGCMGLEYTKQELEEEE